MSYSSIPQGSTLPSRGEYPVTITQEFGLLVREVLRQQKVLGPPEWVPIVLKMSGPLQIPVLQAALNGLVKRHAALRARFFRNELIPAAERATRLKAFYASGIFTPGLYVQRLVEESPVLLLVTDVQKVPEADRQTVIRERFDFEVSQRLNSYSQTLIRADLFRLTPQEHLLFVLVDHIVCDLWSANLITRDLLRLYAQFLGPEPPAVEPTETSFLDYAVWQREQIDRTSFEPDAAYWRDQWAEYGDDRIAQSEFPFYGPTPTAHSGNSGTANARNSLTEEMSSAVVRRARELRVTLHAFLFTAFTILVRHYTRRNKLAFMGHFANRSCTEMEDVVGWFTHTHLIGINIPGEATISELVTQMGRQLLGALAHDRMPTPLLWQLLRCFPRVPDARVLMDTYPPAEVPVSLPDGVIVESLPPPVHNQPRFSSLGVYVSWEGPQIVLTAQTSLAAFSPDAAATIISDLTHVVGQLVSVNVHTPVAAIPMHRRYGEQSPAVANSHKEMSEYILLSSRLIPTTFDSGGSSFER